MSKKNLKDGLESLFGGPAVAEPSLPENSPLLERTSGNKELDKSALTNTKHRKRSKSGKNFTSDLDTLFEAALSDPIKDRPSSKPKSGHGSSRRVVGLDALIQKTTDDNIDYTSTKKRVTFIFGKKKLDKLKKIAKLENAYLKDVIGKIVGDHISKYNEDGSIKA